MPSLANIFDGKPNDRRRPGPYPVSAKKPSLKSQRCLDRLNFFLADVQSGVGPFMAVYLSTTKWNEEQIGLALTVSGLAGIAAQTPAGALVDSIESKRTLIAPVRSCWRSASSSSRHFRIFGRYLAVN